MRIPTAFELGTFSAAKKSLTLQLSSCVRCTPLEIDGKALHITGAAPRVDDGKRQDAVALRQQRGSSPTRPPRRLGSRRSTDARVQMVIKVSDRKRWQVGGKDGLLVDVLAWRVITPCTGAVVIASRAVGKCGASTRSRAPAPATK